MTPRPGPLKVSGELSFAEVFRGKLSSGAKEWDTCTHVHILVMGISSLR